MADDRYVYLENVQPGVGANNSVKWAQTELNRQVGARLLVDGIFGPVTKAASARWQTLAGYAPDGTPGEGSLSALGALACQPWTVKRKPAEETPTTPTQPSGDNVANYLTAAEPAMDMTRTTWSGKTINKRTSALLKRAEEYAGKSISLTQGSYNAGGVAASAGTHAGGGVVDLNVSAWDTATRKAVVLALRKAGFAAWLRTPAEGFAYHIHANAIGDREMSSSAKAQVRDYFVRRNGLANHASDNTEHRWPNWADRYNK
jgi:hypothetical protein